MCDGGSHGGQPDPGSMCSRMSRVEQGVTDAKTPLPHPSFHVILSSFISVHHKSISTGAPKTPRKTRLARILGSGPKLVHHQQAQKHAGARWIPNKQSALPCRPLRGRTLSGVPAPRGTVGKRPRARLAGKINPQKRAQGPFGRQNQPPKISRRPASHPLEQPPPVTTRPYLAPFPLHRPKKAL
jgi:hypothetical protein